MQQQVFSSTTTTSTADPGNSILIATLVFSALLLFVILPLMVHFVDPKPTTTSSSSQPQAQQQREGPREFLQQQGRVDDGESSSASGSSSFSCLSQLDHDQVSIQDAVDAHDGIRHDDSGLHPLQRQATRDINYHSDTAWNVKVAWERLLQVAEYDTELRRLLELSTVCTSNGSSIPLLLLEGLMELVQVSLMGHYFGTRALSAYLIVRFLVDWVVGLLLSGFSESVGELCREAVYEQHKQMRLAGQYLQLSIFLFLLAYTPFAVFLFFSMKHILQWFGLDDETVNLGVSFASMYLFVVAVSGVSRAFDSVLVVALEHQRYTATLSALQSVVKTLGIIALVVAGNSHTTLQNVGFVLLANATVGLLTTTCTILVHGWLDAMLGGMIGSLAILVRFYLFKMTCHSVVY